MINERRIEKVTVFKGQKSGLGAEAYGFESAIQSQNFCLKEGKLERVQGGVFYASILEEEQGGVSSLHRFKNLWLAQRGFAISLETLEGSKIFDTIFSSLSYADKMYSATWRDRIFLVNGKDAKFILNRKNNAIDPDYEADELGMDPPPYSTLNLSLDATGEMVANDFPETSGSTNRAIGYVLTVYDGETNSESPGWGSRIGTDGLYNLSPNVKPIVLATKVQSTTLPNPPDTFKVRFNFASGGGGEGIGHYLNFVKSINPRATHFSLYRGNWITGVGQTPTGKYLIDSCFRVPLLNAGTQDGSVIINIDQFLDDGLDFVDNTNNGDLPAISLAQNNSPPVTIRRFLDDYDALVDGGYTPADTFIESEFSGFTQVKLFRDQLFGIGARSPGFKLVDDLPADWSPTTKNTTPFSDILLGSEVYQPDYMTYLWEVGRGDGQNAIGIAVLGDTALLVFKDRSTYYLTGSSPADYVMRILDTNKGCQARGSIQETPFGVITLDGSGFVLFNKIAQGDKISNEIQDIIDSILFEYADTFYSWYDNNNHRYYCAVVIAGSQVPNITLCLDLDSMGWTYTQGQEGLSRVATTNSSGGFVDVAGMSDNGRLIDSSNIEIPTFQGNQIESIWTSGTLSFGDDQHKKRMRWLYLKVRASGSWTVTIEVVPDFNEARKFQITVNYSSEQGTWFSSDAATDGTLYWDEGVWAFDGPERSQVKIPIICKGRLFQVRVINRDTADNRWGFAMEGISAEAVMLDK